VERLWNDPRSDEHREKLYPLASRIRTVFRRQEIPATLSTSPGADHYRLDMDDGMVDLHRFRRLVDKARDAARTGQHPVAVRLFTEALDLWQEPPLADLDANAYGRHRPSPRTRRSDAFCTRWACRPIAYRHPGR
jgi:hypothetical protein